MSKNIFSNEALADWLAKQPAHGTYNYQDSQQCMLHQYLTAKGVPVRSVDHNNWTDHNWVDHPLPAGWDDACNGGVLYAGGCCSQKWTFGKARKRLLKLMAQQEKIAA